MKTIYFIFIGIALFTYFIDIKRAESAPQEMVIIGMAVFWLILARIVQAENFGNAMTGQRFMDIFYKRDKPEDTLNKPL